MKSLILFPDENLRHNLDDDGFHASTAQMIYGCLNQGTVQGLSFDELSRRLTIKKATKKVEGGGELVLDDADAVVLQRVVEATQWGVLSDAIPSFVDAVRAMAPWSPPS